MSKHVLIIAEAGVNHNGSLELAKQLIDKAVEAGVDIIKFQTFKSEKLVSKAAKQAEYQQRNIGKQDEGQLAMLKKLELSKADHEELIAYCKEKGIRFFSTAFDMDSIDYLHSLDMGLWKIPSGEITNYPYLRKIAQYKESVILSTGMCELSDIEAALNVLLKFGVKKEQITILHCNTEYPTPFADVNLKAMLEIGEKFGVQIGYSDHTEGIEVPIAAVALGAEEIEFDIWSTKDKVLVSCHDDTLDRVSDGSGKIYEHTYAELLRLDFGVKHGEKFTMTQLKQRIRIQKFCKSSQAELL